MAVQQLQHSMPGQMPGRASLSMHSVTDWQEVWRARSRGLPASGCGGRRGCADVECQSGWGPWAGCWLAGLLACWLAGLLACWLAGLLACWLAGLLRCALTCDLRDVKLVGSRLFASGLSQARADAIADARIPSITGQPHFVLSADAARATAAALVPLDYRPSAGAKVQRPESHVLPLHLHADGLPAEYRVQPACARRLPPTLLPTSLSMTSDGPFG
jgi:hypothetical protein